MSTQSVIGNKIWGMANELRGTMDASEYKNYILPLIFYRYLSDKQEDELKDMDLMEDYIESVKNKEDMELYRKHLLKTNGYFIEPVHTWRNLMSKIKEGRTTASDFHDMITSFNENVEANEDATKTFKGLFDDMNLGDSRLGDNVNERTKSLYQIVEIIDELEYKGEGGKDILGDIYEYLISKFAASAGQKAGEFYTPHEVSKILAKIVTDGVNAEDDFSVYDPTMGSGSLLLTVSGEHPADNDQGKIKFAGQELNTTTYNLARMNLLMHGVPYEKMELRRGDTLEEDWPRRVNGVDLPAKFDAVVANPPYGISWDNTNKEKDPRFKAGVAAKSKAEYAFVQHSLYHLDRKGTMAVVLPHGVLFRGGSEAKIREQLIRENRLDAVIGLPKNIFFGTGIPTCILVFKGEDAKDTRDVFFIDASEEFEKAKNKNILREDHIDKIMDVYKKRESVDKFAHKASFEELEENEFNLNIPRYVDTFEEEEVMSLDEIFKELTKVDDDMNKTQESIIEMMKDLTSEDETLKEGIELIVKNLSE